MVTPLNDARADMNLPRRYADQKKIWEMPVLAPEHPGEIEVVFLEDEAFSPLPKHFTRTLLQIDLW